MSPIRVLFIDDSKDIRDLYRRLLSREPDLECVATLESTVGLEETIQRTDAQVAVVDLVAPGRDSLDAIRSAAPAFPDCRIIAFSGHDDDATRHAALEAGAWALVSKHQHPLSLIGEIRRVRSL